MKIRTTREALTGTLQAHRWHQTGERRCTCGWNADAYMAGDPVEQYAEHVAETLLAVDAAPLMDSDGR